MKNKYSIGNIFFHTVKKHIVIALVTILAIIAAALCALAAPVILGEAVDDLSTGIPVSIRLIILYFVFTACSGLLEALKEALITIFGQKITHELRSAMSEKLYRLPSSYYVNNSPGQVSSRFVNDVDTVEELFSSGIISMISDLFTVISIMAVIFTRSRGLGILLAIVLPLVFLMTRFFQKRMLSAQIAVRRAVARTSGHLPDTLQNIKAVHVFHAEAFLEKKYRSYINEHYQAMEKSNFYDAVYSPIIVTVSSLVTAVMMSLAAQGGKYAALFGMSVGTAVTVISYVGKVFDPIQSIGMEIQSIQSAMAGLARIREFMQEKERTMPMEKSAVRKDAPALDIADVTFGYNKDQPVLHDFSLTLQPSEKVTLTGRTGCGKSTLLRLIAGLYQPDEGKISVFGQKADQISDQERRTVFGYVEQNFVPVPGTIRDQLKLGDERVDSKAIEEALRITGLKDEINNFPNGLDTVYDPSLFSRGQQQLLNVARAIVLNPAILLLDEINANLDAETERKLNEALEQAALGRTVISISHRMNRAVSSRIIQMDQSELSMQQTHTAVK